MRLAAIVLTTSFVFSTCSRGASAAEVVRRTARGASVRFDAAKAQYDYRAADGVRMARLWIPIPAERVRGVFVLGNPGGIGGDVRFLAREPAVSALARRHHFAILALANFVGTEVYASGGRELLDALTDFAALGSHPELAHAPLIPFGDSNAGMTAYGLVNFAPERVLCWSSNVGLRFEPKTPIAAALEVPGIIVVGPEDPFFPNGPEEARVFVEHARRVGARWAWAVEPGKGHESGHVRALDLAFFDACIQKRSIPEEQGWLVAPGGSLDRELASFAQYKGDRRRAGWLIDQDVALLFRALSARDRLPIRAAATGQNAPWTDGGVLASGAELVVELDPPPATARIELYERARLLHVLYGPPFTAQLAPRGFSVLTASAFDVRGRLSALAPPIYVFGEAREAVPTRPPLAAAPAVRVDPNACKTAALLDRKLIAYALDAAAEAGFDSRDRRLSSFWARIARGCDRLELNPASNAGPEARFSRVLANDAVLRVAAAHGARGLYLAFTVIDRDFVAPPLGETSFSDDAIDVLLDPRSSAELYAGPPADMFFMPASYALTPRTIQLQVSSGDRRPPSTIRFSFVEAWEMTPRSLPLERASEELGIAIDFQTIDANTHTQEWLIPWTVLGLDRPPREGAQLAFAVGYNDRDPGEHVGPGYDRLRWPERIGPWHVAGNAGANPKTWGDVELGPRL